jgi:RNA-directed DNA polymerase
MYDARTRIYLARCLADAFLAGPWDERALADRARSALDRRPRWLSALIREVLAAYPRPPGDRPRELAAFVALDLERRTTTGPEPPAVRRWFVPETTMGRRRWPVPELTSSGALAEWLGLGTGELEWLADARSLERTAGDERLRNYRYRAIARRGGPPRVIERPKARLMAIQRRLLHEILDWIPAHPAAHGFTRGRSAASHAAEHVARAVVVGLDLEDFFASVSAARVYGLYRTAGYPESVAHTLTALCANAIPFGVWRALHDAGGRETLDAWHRLGRRLATPHLPQGAPTSPALANLAAFRLDARLTGLAAALGVTYSRYADDLTFSGSERLIRGANRLRATIGQIVRDEGFAINERKSMLATRAGRQRVCGIVVNERLNVSRADYEELKAIIHNAALRGPVAENRDRVNDFRAHLRGRIGWVASLHPRRGEKLAREFARIDWTAGG